MYQCRLHTTSCFACILIHSYVYSFIIFLSLFRPAAFGSSLFLPARPSSVWFSLPLLSCSLPLSSLPESFGLPEASLFLPHPSAFIFRASPLPRGFLSFPCSLLFLPLLFSGLQVIGKIPRFKGGACYSVQASKLLENSGLTPRGFSVLSGGLCFAVSYRAAVNALIIIHMIPRGALRVNNKSKKYCVKFFTFFCGLFRPQARPFRVYNM